jgi:predicted peptidase
MNFKEIKSKFLLYLQNKQNDENNNNTIPVDLSAKSIFLYQDDFKNFLKEECNIKDSSLLSMSITDILKMNAEDENNAETYDANDPENAPENDEAGEENNAGNWLTEFANELFNDDAFKTTVDSDKNGKIEENELNTFLDKIKDLDGNSDSVSLDDLFKTYEAINDGTINDITGKTEASEETAEDNDTKTEETKDTQDTPKTQDTPSSSGSNNNYNGGNNNVTGGDTGTENAGPKTLDNMSEEELNQEKTDAKAELDKNQAAYESITDGSNSELKELDKEVTEAYDNYKEALDSDMAEKLDKIVSEISKVENDISQKEIEISKQTTVVSNAKNNADNAQTTYETMDAAVKALEAQSSSASEEEDSADLNQKIAAAKARRERAKTDAEKAKKDYEKEQEKLEKLENELGDLKTGENGLEKLNKEKQEFEAQIDENSDAGQLMKKYNEAKAKYDTKKSSLQTEAKTAIEASQKRLDEVNTALNNYKDKKEVSEKYSSTAGLFSSDVKMTRQLMTDEKTGMQYYLMAPEGTDPTKDELPMLLYLHGGSSKGTYDKSAFESMKSSPGVFLKDTNFKGYIVCPVLPAGSRKWDDENVAKRLDNFLTSFTSSHKVNKDKIALSGVSLGGSGTVYMADKLKKWFCKAAAISPARGSLNSTVPIKLFFGSNDGANCLNYKNQVLSAYSNADVTSVGQNVKGQQVFHTWAAAKSYEIDNDGDGNSDLLKWLFS